MRPSLVLLASLLPCALAPASAPAQEAFVVIAHPTVPGGQIKKETLLAVFLMQMTRWSDGSAIRPVDQSARAPLRASFSQQALGQSVAAVTSYWARQITSGKGPPPPVKTSDAEVIAYVKANAGAIGYVAAGSLAEDSGVKLLKLLE
jgi:ABC-type phosphate transport system substrate-binding protein